MPIQYIGRTTDFKGKTLWEILGNLKNYGVGRLIIRNRFQRYPEPSFFKVLKVAAMPNEETRLVAALIEGTFRGRKDATYLQLKRTTYKPDYMLIPKDKEYLYYRPIEPYVEKLLPRTMELPPLLRELLCREMKTSGISVTEEPKMPIIYNETGNKIYRLAKEGETPTVEVTIGLGEPASPSLYANVKK